MVGGNNSVQEFYCQIRVILVKKGLRSCIINNHFEKYNFKFVMWRVHEPEIGVSEEYKVYADWAWALASTFQFNT